MFTSRPLFRASLASIKTAQSATNPLNSRPTHVYRTMATNSAPLQEWLVIAPDFEGALDKRLAVRQEHLGGLKKDREDMWLWGGKQAIHC